MADYKAQLEKARVEATAIVEEGRRDAQAVRQRLQEDARREADELVARARREVQIATEAAIKSIYDEAAQLAVDVAGQVVRKQFKADDQRQLVTESIARMKAARAPTSMN
jgi:F-type H+-transporting ATPase subunit b